MWKISHFNAKSLSFLKRSVSLIFIAEFCVCSFVFSVLWKLWGIFGSFVIFDGKYCSHSATGYNFQAESRSPCDLKETNKRVNTMRHQRKMSQTCNCHQLVGLVAVFWSGSQGLSWTCWNHFRTLIWYKDHGDEGQGERIWWRAGLGI